MLRPNWAERALGNMWWLLGLLLVGGVIWGAIVAIREVGLVRSFLYLVGFVGFALFAWGVICYIDGGENAVSPPTSRPSPPSPLASACSGESARGRSGRAPNMIGGPARLGPRELTVSRLIVALEVHLARALEGTDDPQRLLEPTNRVIERVCALN